jgi:hypothetical protein
MRSAAPLINYGSVAHIPLATADAMPTFCFAPASARNRKPSAARAALLQQASNEQLLTLVACASCTAHPQACSTHCTTQLRLSVCGSV